MTRGERRLIAGMIAGAVVALHGLMVPATPALPGDAAAQVGDSVIHRRDYQRALEAVSRDRRDSAITPALRQRALDRLIDEALLIERGAELDLLRRDRQLRAAVGRAVIDLVTSEAGPADQATLRAFYADNQAFFGPTARVTLVVRSFATAAAAAAASPEASRATGDVAAPPVPTGSIPLESVATWLGARGRQAASALPIGGSAVVRDGPAYHRIYLVDRVQAPAPPFEVVATSVAEEWRRRAAEAQLASFLDAQRRRTAIAVAEDLE